MFECLGEDPFRDNADPPDRAIHALIAEPLEALGASLDNFIDRHDDRIGEDHAAQQPWRQFKARPEELRRTGAQWSAATPRQLQDLVKNVRSDLDDLGKTQVGITRELRRDVLHNAAQVERLLNLYALHWLDVQMTIVTNELHARVSGGQKHSGVCPLAPAVQQAIANLAPKAQRRNIRINLYDHTDGQELAMPPSEFNRAFENILDNAIKYTGELGPNDNYDHLWIEVRLDRVGDDRVTVEVENWGVGVTAAELEGGLLFHAFKRGFFARRRVPEEGVGQGLADVKQCVERYGGNVEFLPDRTLDKRADVRTNIKTTVRLTLPVETTA